MRRIILKIPTGVCEIKVLTLREDPPADRLCDTPERAFAIWSGQVPSAQWYTGDVETFVCFHLNTRRQVIAWNLVSIGTLDTLLVHPREVFRNAIIANASAVILAHNHPSGDPTPSEADIKVTRDLIRAGQILKIEVLDHLIIGAISPERPRPYVSLRELGYFYA